MTHAPWRAEPLPTVEQVRELLTVIHGGYQRPSGDWYPNTTVVARRFRVARKTSQRWLAGPPGTPTRMPARRVTNLLRRHLPTRAVLRREGTEQKQWERKQRRRELGRGRGNIDEYARLGWLDRHRVGIYREEHSPLCRILVARDAPNTRANQTRGLLPLAELIVGDRIDAELIRHEGLRLMRPWRIQVSRARLRPGHTQTWLAGAPLLPLEAIANGLQIDDYEITLSPRTPLREERVGPDHS